MAFRLKLTAENRAGLFRHGVVTAGEHINRGVAGFRPGVDGNVGFRQQGKACDCLLYTSPSPRDVEESRMPSSA